jgi:hypothetical protein
MRPGLNVRRTHDEKRMRKNNNRVCIEGYASQTKVTQDIERNGEKNDDAEEMWSYEESGDSERISRGTNGEREGVVDGDLRNLDGKPTGVISPSRACDPEQ